MNVNLTLTNEAQRLMFNRENFQRSEKLEHYELFNNGINTIATVKAHCITETSQFKIITKNGVSICTMGNLVYPKPPCSTYIVSDATAKWNVGDCKFKAVLNTKNVVLHIITPTGMYAEVCGFDDVLRTSEAIINYAMSNNFTGYTFNKYTNLIDRKTSFAEASEELINQTKFHHIATYGDVYIEKPLHYGTHHIKEYQVIVCTFLNGEIIKRTPKRYRNGRSKHDIESLTIKSKYGDLVLRPRFFPFVPTAAQIAHDRKIEKAKIIMTLATDLPAIFLRGKARADTRLHSGVHGAVAGILQNAITEIENWVLINDDVPLDGSILLE